MKDYKRLGDYIREVDVRNRELTVTNLIGLSINKVFIPSVANIIGTDLSNYKIITKEQFACSLMQVSRDEKIPIAMFTEDIAIMSPAYPMFEVIDKSILLPQYLMMWFSRKEFDREASFYAVGGVRGSLTWEDFCDMRLPVPPIEKQREIVAEYETLSNRISINQQIIQNLEATAQALYRKMFVDGIDKENLPDGWRMGTLGEVCEISSSKRIFESEYCEEGIPFYRGKEITQKKKGEQITDLIYISRKRYNELIRNYGRPMCGDILLTAVGTIGNSYMVENEDFYFKDGNLVWFHDFSNIGVNYYIYEYMQGKYFDKAISEMAIGSTQKAITIQSLLSLEILVPNSSILREFANMAHVIYRNLQIQKQENSKLTELQSLLLAKMGR